MKKIFMLAGEPSGDHHGAYLLKQLNSNSKEIKVKGWGGQEMKTAGVEILRSLDHLAFMGFIEVAKNFNTVLKNFSLCKEHISAFDPDVIVFVDYPGFNLRMAKWAKAKGYKTVQYIAPAVWAWKESRVNIIRKYIDELLVILPFEKAYFARHGIDAQYVGHPLTETIQSWTPDSNFQLEKIGVKNIALFPGSRKQELKYMMPVFMDLAREINSFQFHIAVPNHFDLSDYEQFIGDVQNVSFVKGKNYDLLSKADAAVVTSGTATLEVALFDIPQVVCYNANYLSYSIAKKLVKTKYISLVNLICEEEVVKELIQEDLNVKNLKTQITKLLDTDQNKVMKEKYAKLKKIMSLPTEADFTKIIL